MTDTPIERIARDLPRLYPGPGGAAAVLRNGEVVLRHAWGFANAEQRLPFTPRTLFRICSITKQFACATLLAPRPSEPSPPACDTAAASAGVETPTMGA